MIQIDVKKSSTARFCGEDVPAVPADGGADPTHEAILSTSIPTGIWVAPVDGTYASFSPLAGDISSSGRLQKSSAAAHKGPASTTSMDLSLGGILLVAPTDGTNMSFAPLKLVMASSVEGSSSAITEDGRSQEKDFKDPARCV